MAPCSTSPDDGFASAVRSSPLSFDALNPGGPKLLHDYWTEKRGLRRMPARGDVDPLELKAVLPHILLIDVARTPLDFRFRLAGTRTYHIFGVDLTGRSVREVEPPALATIVWDSLSELAATGVPQYVQLEF